MKTLHLEKLGIVFLFGLITERRHLALKEAAR